MYGETAPRLFWSRCFFLASSQHLDELRGDRMIGPRILTRDELAVDNHVGLKIWPNDYLASYEAADCSELPAKLASAI